MARPTITLTNDQVREVETLAALLNQDQIADYFGISRTTFKAIRERDAEVAVRYKRGKARAIAHVANGLLQKARASDTTSSIFYLKTQAGWREQAPPEDMGNDYAGLSDEDLIARFQAVEVQFREAVGSAGPFVLDAPDTPEAGS
ncbi:hypothetical protein KU6B_34930 [Mameliella alba]|uniref:hypothetical protein n=1 Tax=Mameliella alba TaxID=561184 RepID=UPI0013E49C18|nr:hypothetical protein [Mameliella alba]BBU57228.1 hypothetical protein KU6B_34930 [Mameliella alba]